MSLSSFYISFITALNQHHVEYLVVGGQAVNVYGYIRATLDLDIWINKTNENLERLKKAFLSLGYNNKKSSEAISYFKENHKITIPKDQNLVEILDEMVLKSDFSTSFSKKNTENIEGLSFNVIDIDTLIDIKSRSNRLQDLSDAEKLKEIKGGNTLEDSDDGYILE